MISALINRFLSRDVSTTRPVAVRNERVAGWMAERDLRESSRGVWLTGDGRYLGLTWPASPDKTACHVIRLPKACQQSPVPKKVEVRPFRTKEEIRQYGETAWRTATDAHFAADGNCTAFIDDGCGGFRWVFCTPGNWRFVR